MGELHSVKLQSTSTDNHPLQCHLRNRTSAQRNQSLFVHPSHRTSPSGSNARQRITHRLAQRCCPRRAQAIEAAQKRENYARVGDTHTSRPNRTITSRPATQETKKAQIRHGSPCTTWHVHAQSAQASLLKLEIPPASRATQLGFDSLLVYPRQKMIIDDDDKGCALRTRSCSHSNEACIKHGGGCARDSCLNCQPGLWSTVFEHGFITHVRHSPTHTPESRTWGIVIARTKYVKHKHWSSHIVSQANADRFFGHRASHPGAPNYLSSRRCGRSNCETVCKRCASRPGPTQQPRTGIRQNPAPI